MKLIKKIFNKKTFSIVIVIYLIDIMIGALVMRYVDVVGYAQKYSEEVLLGVIWIIFLSALFKRFRRRKKRKSVATTPVTIRIYK